MVDNVAEQFGAVNIHKLKGNFADLAVHGAVHAPCLRSQSNDSGFATDPDGCHGSDGSMSTVNGDAGKNGRLSPRGHKRSQSYDLRHFNYGHKSSHLIASRSVSYSPMIERTNSHPNLGNGSGQCACQSFCDTSKNFICESCDRDSESPIPCVCRGDPQPEQEAEVASKSSSTNLDDSISSEESQITEDEGRDGLWIGNKLNGTGHHPHHHHTNSDSDSDSSPRSSNNISKLHPQQVDLRLSLEPIPDESRTSSCEKDGSDVTPVNHKPPSGKKGNKGQNAEAKQTSWLLRLFESKLFDMSIAIQYLFNSKEPGVQTYLGEYCCLSIISCSCVLWYLYIYSSLSALWPQIRKFFLSCQISLPWYICMAMEISK